MLLLSRFIVEKALFRSVDRRRNFCVFRDWETYPNKQNENSVLQWDFYFSPSVHTKASLAIE